jgi:hypothetical protein
VSAGTTAGRGDRLVTGRYVIAVTFDEDTDAQSLVAVPQHLTAQAVRVALFLRAGFLRGARRDAAPLARGRCAHLRNRPGAIAGAAARPRRRDS